MDIPVYRKGEAPVRAYCIERKTKETCVSVDLCLDGGTGGQSRPPLQRVVQRFKSITTRKCWVLGHKTLWQRSFYDHVIRNEAEYRRIWQYIDDNPAGWAEDEYYVK